VPHALNELDNPFVVAVDPFGSVYIADLAGQFQRIASNCALSSPYAGAVSGVASKAQDNIYFSDPQHIKVWRLPAAPRLQAAVYSSASFPPIIQQPGRSED
jgi:hypothetical protein